MTFGGAREKTRNIWPCPIPRLPSNDNQTHKNKTPNPVMKGILGEYGNPWLDVSSFSLPPWSGVHNYHILVSLILLHNCLQM